MLSISYVLGQRHNQKSTGIPYESGVSSTGSARGRMSIDFYMVAMFFVIFDLEAIFVVSWAVAVRELGWIGFVEIALFITILFVGLAYLWRLGALDWGPSAKQRKQRSAMRKRHQQTTHSEDSLFKGAA